MKPSAARLVVTFAAVLGLFGCEPPQPPVLPDPPVSEPAPTRSTGSTRSASALPTQAEVDASLLTAQELPGGPYTVSQTPSDGAAGGAVNLGKGIRDCAGDSTSGERAVSAQRVFQSGLIGPFVVELLTVTSHAEAERQMRALANVVDNCSSFSGGLPGLGGKVDVTIGPLTVAPMGDQTHAFRMTATTGGIAIYAHVVTVRTGNVLVAVEYVTALTPPDVQQTVQLVRLALDKAAPLRGAS
jgi:hypothetical protein